MAIAKQTALYELHLKLKAKMTLFAGYQMPLQYQNGIISEHVHCRSKVGFFDISHMLQLWLTGNNAAASLEKLSPSAISKLKIGQQLYTVLTNSLGGIIDDIVVTRFEDGFLLVVNAACRDKDLIQLKTLLNPECKISVLNEQALFALQGPDAVKVLEKYCPDAKELNFMQSRQTLFNGEDCIVSRCGYTGEDGFEISITNQNALVTARLLLADKRVKPIGLGARDSLRLEAGLCLYGHELDETINPVAAGLTWTFRNDLKSLIGGDKLLQAKEKGTQQKRVGLLVEGKRPVRAGYLLFNQQGLEIGKVTSGSYSPVLKQPIAMAYIDSDEISNNACLYAQIRDKKIPVTITQLPFVPHRYHRQK